MGGMRALALLLLVAAPAAADVVLADLFSELVVLQRQKRIPIWGRADPGEGVAVTFQGQTASTTTGRDGRWRVEIGPFEALAARPLTVTGKNTIRIERVFVGEVWVCSGQSNMAFSVQRSEGAQEELEGLVNPRLMLYTVKRRVAGEPQESAGGRWVRASPETVAKFSAVAYYFGKRLRSTLAIPVGLIHSSWGGTPAEAWTRRETLARDPVLRPIVERWDRALAEGPQREQAWKRSLDRWKQQAEAARAAGRPAPRRPRPPLGPNHPHRASGLFDGMIAPVIPFAIRGAIWYQGESNAGRAEQYRTLFPAMIRDWRAAWGQGDFPFYFVQLANFRPIVTEPGDSAWAELRDAQRFALKEKNTAMAVTIDIGAADDIHPRNKREVGRRLALAALANLYREELGDKPVPVEAGPLYESHRRKGNRLVVRFRFVGGGLRTRNGDPLSGFTIAGKKMRFLQAQARIEGDTVVVWHPRLKRPAAVRYAWADNPVCNLVNAEGLPASPFRTDDRPGLTAGKR